MYQDISCSFQSRKIFIYCPRKKSLYRNICSPISCTEKNPDVLMRVCNKFLFSTILLCHFYVELILMEIALFELFLQIIRLRMDE